ncbi:DNA-formamidopyrimidine glycosylase [Leptolyngbya ohadii]|uniref:DNA-formamidopyrimidine glycosylase n=1 Tax=Leptolyngbya ohadii TaxID=1962290 RepID=UPI000B5A12EE|nr:DNA-formamidopyrimidine glycosylase [Leptolyngbya ohadii]
MPELPEVETVRRGLNRVTLNQPMWNGAVLLDRTIAYPGSTPEFLAGIAGKSIAQWQRRGKYLLADLADGTANPAGCLGVHLRMTGQLLWMAEDEPLQKHARVRLFFPEGRELRFVDQRTFGQMWYVPPDRPPESIITGLRALGVEPLSAEFTADYLAERLQNRKRPIKNALLDQAIVAGIGNIYADESLFLSQIRPETLASDLKPDQIQRLHQSIIKVLQDSIGAGGTTFSDFRDIQGINGNYGGIAWVYDRKGEPCRTCETPIERIKLAGRSAHYCPSCQPSA